MKTVELVLRGFDGGTDKTDHKIIWIGIPDNLEIVLNNQDKSNPVKSISEIPIRFPTSSDLLINEIITDFDRYDENDTNKT